VIDAGRQATVHWICLVYAPRSNTIIKGWLGLACPVLLTAKTTPACFLIPRKIFSTWKPLLTPTKVLSIYSISFDSPSVNCQTSASCRHICVKKSSFMRPAVWCLADADNRRNEEHPRHGLESHGQDHPRAGNLSLRPHNRS
jgi:hypothetical protein